MNNIFIFGACEISHFSALTNAGFNRFIISNVPSDDFFVSMKVIEELFTKFSYCDFYLLEVPSTKEVYNYYESKFLKNGKRLQFFDDISNLEFISSIEIVDINALLKNRVNYLLNITSFMKSYRELDVQKCLDAMVLR